MITKLFGHKIPGLALSVLLISFGAGAGSAKRIDVRAGGPARITKGEIRDRTRSCLCF